MNTMISNLYSKLPSVSAENVRSWASSAKDFALNNRISTFVSNLLSTLAGMTWAFGAGVLNQIDTARVSLWNLPRAGKVAGAVAVIGAFVLGAYLGKSCAKEKAENKESNAGQRRGQEMARIRDLHDEKKEQLPPANITLDPSSGAATLKPGT